MISNSLTIILVGNEENEDKYGHHYIGDGHDYQLRAPGRANDMNDGD